MGWLKQILSRRRRYDELAESIREHLEEKINDLMEDGLSREEATYKARREFGNVTLIEERSREVWQWPRLESLIRDMRCGARMLLKKPGFTLIVLITLALGIGANTAIFSVVNSVLLRPLPFYEPERLIGVWQTAPGVNITNLNASIGDYVTYREHSTTFADVVLTSGMSASVTEFADPERVEALLTTFRLLPILGAQPILEHRSSIPQ
jgi:hypothetical protein